MQTDEGRPGLVKLHSTRYSADGEGPRVTNEVNSRHWYGKKRRIDTSTDGVTMTQPVPAVKSRKRKLRVLKKMLNIGEKLKPLGLGGGESRGADFDGQEAAKEQEEEDPPSKTPHISQDGAQTGCLEQQEAPLLQRRDLLVQVCAAKDLKGMDSNGLSDPYTWVKLGGTKFRTKTVAKSLNPLWNETFVFPATDVEAAKGARLVLELWDSDFLSKDEFLGQAHIDLKHSTMRSRPEEPVWLPLYGEKDGSRIEGLGRVRVAVWLSGDGDMGRLSETSSAAASTETKLTSLCCPAEVGKVLPLVVHTDGNCLYEEPCIHYLRLAIEQVRDLEHLLVSPSGRKSTEDHGVTVGAKTESIQEDEGGFSPEERVSRRPWRGSRPASDDESSGADSDSSGLDDDGQDPFEEVDNFENPLQVPSSEDNAAPSSTAPLSDKRLYFEVSFGSQRRRTKIARLKDHAFTWNQGLAFAATVPMKDRWFKLLLCEVDRQNQKSRLLAIAFIQLSRLTAMSETTDRGVWFKLHDYNKRLHSKPIAFGAVKLSLRGADADERRQLYRIPLLEPRTEGADAGKGPLQTALAEREHSTSSSLESRDASLRQLHVDAALAGRQPDQTGPTSWAGSADIVDSMAGKYASSISAYFDEKRAQLRMSVISADDATGASKMLWEALSLVLLLLQFCLALLARAFWSQNTLMKRSTKAWRRMMRHWTRAKGSKVGHHKCGPAAPPPDVKPLGLVKLVLSSVELREQPVGNYFCVLKCGPHWGQTTHQKDSTGLHWKWEVHLPLYQPNTLLLLSLFREQTSHWRKSSPPLHVGKLRIRLNTLVAGQQYAAKLPMLSDRKSGGKLTASAHLKAKVIYFEERRVIKRYFKAESPPEIYELDFTQGDTSKQLDYDQARMTHRWLQSTKPPISRAVAKSVTGNERRQFIFSRAKANWTRFMYEKERFTWIVRFWRRNQAWENPAESLTVMVGLVAFSFRPQTVLIAALLSLMAYTLLTAPKRPDKPAEMHADPLDDDEDNEEVADKGGIVQLRRKYERLVRVALAVQNYLEDFANVLERLHGFISWSDPKATLIFLFACLVITLAMTALSLPVVLSITLCWTVRPPCMRSPTPPAPLSFFARIPTRSDQII